MITVAETLPTLTRPAGGWNAARWSASGPERQEPQGALPTSWVTGINFENTSLAGLVTFMNFNSDASEFFIKHPAFELKHAGESAPLALFKGAIDILDPEVVLAVGQTHISLRDSSVAHGMTDLVPTDVIGTIRSHNADEGGLNIAGWKEGVLVGRALVLEGTAHAGSDQVPTVIINAYEKSGTDRAALTGTDIILGVGGSETAPTFRFRANGTLELDDGSTNPGKVATIEVSGSAPSGDYPEGTIWAQV